MKRIIGGVLIPIIWTFYILAGTAHGYGHGNVAIHLNGGRDVAYINEVNTLEIWIANDAILSGMVIGFEITFATALSWDTDYGSYPPVNDEGRAVGCWNATQIFQDFDDVSPDHIKIIGIAVDEYEGLPAGWGELCYTLQFYIPASESPADDGISVATYLYEPVGNWMFEDSAGYYPPDFDGNPESSIIDPIAPPITFDVVRRIICGDANCDYEVNISDAVYTINYIFKGGPAPCGDCP